MNFRVNVTTFDPVLVEAMTRLGKRRGVYIEKALGEFLLTKKGKDVFQMMISEGGEIISDEPKPAPKQAKHKTPKPKQAARQPIPEQKPQEPQEQEQGSGKIDLDSFL